MSLLIKALQRAEKSKAQATQPERSLKEAEAGSISFDPFPSNQDGPAGYTLSDKSAYPETSVNSLLKDQEAVLKRFTVGDFLVANGCCFLCVFIYLVCT